MIATTEIRSQVKKQVLDFFAEECEVERESITEETKIIEDLNGDSLMFLELITKWKEEYNLDIELRVIGKYLTKNPTENIGKVIDLACLMIEKDAAFVD